MSSEQLVDKYGRIIRKLRLSITDRCNLRCRYCMPLEAQFMSKDEYLQPWEYTEIVRELAELGITTVRITGGEPLLRKEFPEIIACLATIPNLELSLTTNAVLLERFLPLLQLYNVKKLNISLDSLKADTFRSITYGQFLDKVKQAIETAVAKGFQVKLNMVVMRHYNDGELVDIVEYSKRLQVEIRFLELMQIGYACHLPQETFVSAQEMIDKLQGYYRFIPITSAPDSTAFRFKTECGATIGFIASESQPFCGHCSRWRLSADGILRACLFREEGIALRGMSREQRYSAYRQLLGMKPTTRGQSVSHAMYQIGG
ncbi:MAG: GTP 3',8-cyclase MoaA [Pseudanabaenaceae cyanobacterium SKYGB_i_bin29]|nr:GTP 3',8-cyclase MoaA [Pseudanabaenaceae cyanobacterium SKYG29]MDW8422018.1 GTP 3',8-cyclase MoaA [Pseudanabaenaceae cyanobacterium SKYGB_i_bin29]